ncbi:helix-turn-helix domain-containing protein [Labilibaculum sp.]|uniref:helix-turn-helix domain-containing protein n=1 Tax=Labilibaculum sp. TaxID=2060723 RepID=UPI003561303D
MSKEDWCSKFQIIQEFEPKSDILSNNSMGIYFECKTKNALIVHFKALNEAFNSDLFTKDKGILINFDRDFIDKDDIEYALDVMSLFNKYPQFIIDDNQQVKRLRHLIDFLTEEYHDESASFILLKTLLKALLLHLIRFQNNGFLQQDLHQKKVFQFLELMETTFLQETKPDYYAREIGISTKRLNQILKEKLHLTAKQIIQQRQITEAKRQLLKREITTKELAFKLGFDSISSFSRFFKKNVGLSPSAFRSRN